MSEIQKWIAIRSIAFRRTLAHIPIDCHVWPKNKCCLWPCSLDCMATHRPNWPSRPSNGFPPPIYSVDSRKTIWSPWWRPQCPIQTTKLRSPAMLNENQMQTQFQLMRRKSYRIRWGRCRALTWTQWIIEAAYWFIERRLLSVAGPMNRFALHILQAAAIVIIGHNSKIARIRIHIEQRIVGYSIAIFVDGHVASDAGETAIPH